MLKMAISYKLEDQTIYVENAQLTERKGGDAEVGKYVSLEKCVNDTIVSKRRIQ